MNTLPDGERSLGFLISDVSRLMRRNFNRLVQPLGQTQAQWRVIAHLGRGEGMKQSELAESLEIQPITLARLIDRMEAAGWVERRKDPKDRRAMRLFLTGKCQPILEQMHTLGAGLIEEVLAGVPAGAREQLIETLQTMRRNLAAAETAAAPGDSRATPQTDETGEGHTAYAGQRHSS